MIDEAKTRRAHIDRHLAEVDGGPSAASGAAAVIGRASMTAGRATGARGTTAFRHRNYRIFFAGQAVSLVGTWMQQVAQAWLVLELTGDPIWLGIVAAAQFIPVMILGLFAGVAADALPEAPDARRPPRS